MLPYPVVSQSEVAAALGVSERTVRRLVHAGSLTALGVSGRPLYDIEAVRSALGIPATSSDSERFKLFCLQEVAQVLGVAPAEVLRRTEAGDLVAVEVGSQLRWPKHLVVRNVPTRGAGTAGAARHAPSIVHSPEGIAE